MRLYIPLHNNDISKAVQIPNAGMDTVSERKNKRNYDESFTRVSPGVSGDNDAPDKPDVGAKWQHDDNDSIDNDVEKERKDDKELNEKRGVVKSLSHSMDLIKSFQGRLQEEKRARNLHPAEVEFLKSYFEGCTDEDISSGRVAITGRHRKEFDKWLCSRLPTSVDKILPRSGR